MDFVLLSQKQLEKYLTEGLKGAMFNQTDSQYTFNTTISLIQALDAMKKRGICQYAIMQRHLEYFCGSGISQLELDQYEIVKALEDSDFVDAYTSHATNPFETARLLSIAYNENCWADSNELLSQV